MGLNKSTFSTEKIPLIMYINLSTIKVSQNTAMKNAQELPEY